MTLKPGKSINDYIDGKRKSIFNPISYALLATTTYLIVSRYLGSRTGISEEDIEAINKTPYFEFGAQIGKFVA